MGNKLDGKIAVVTGGSAGIGLGTAKRFVAEGARVFVTGRNQIELDKAVAEIGGNAIGIQGDISDLTAIDRLYATVAAKAGQIDILFANAGFYEFQPLGAISEEHFDRTFNTNVRGLVFTVQKALPLLSSNSSVILTGSIAATVGLANMSIYCATKAAVNSLARSWILDVKGRGIRINVLSPGYTATPGLTTLLGGRENEGLASTIPLNRLALPEDIAQAALFLASDDSAYITGTEIVVDGGATKS